MTPDSDDCNLACTLVSSASDGVRRARIATIKPAHIVRLGWLLGRCVYALDGPHRRIIRRNLEFVHPRWSRGKITRISRGVFQNLGTTFLEICQLATMSRQDLLNRVEVVGEWGKTFSEGVTSGRDRVCAWAADAALAYFFRKTPTRPKLMVEYLYGSGDGNRRLSSTSTIGGNLAGTKDHAFNAFGFRDTGVALAPRVSNLHIYILGASFFPPG